MVWLLSSTKLDLNEGTIKHLICPTIIDLFHKWRPFLLFFYMYDNNPYKPHFKVKIRLNSAHANEACKANNHKNKRITKGPPFMNKVKVYNPWFYLQVKRTHIPNVNLSSSNHFIMSDDLLMLFQTGALCIHEAAKKGHVGLLKMLLEKGVPVNTKDKVENFCGA